MKSLVIDGFQLIRTQQLVNIEALYLANDVPTRKRWIIPITGLPEFMSAHKQYKDKLKT